MKKQTFTSIAGLGIFVALVAATILAVGGDIPRGGPIADLMLAIGIMAYLPPTLRMVIEWFRPTSKLLVDWAWDAQSDAIAATASTGYFAVRRAHRQTFAGLAARGAIGRDLCVAQQTRAQPSARRAGRQTGGSGTATRQASGSKSADDDGGDGDPDGDPDPATNPNPDPRPDPDPDDRIIADPYNWVNTHPNSRPENRILRKAILARRNPPKNPTKAYVKAHDYYVAHALHDIASAMTHMVASKHRLTHRDMDHISPAAQRLFAKLVTSHDFLERPNPVVRGSTGLVACLAFRTSEGLEKYARGGPYAPTASARKADIRLSKSLGLFPSGEKSWGDALDTDMVVHHADCAEVSDDADDPLQTLIRREAEAIADGAPPEQAGRSRHLVQMPGTLDTMLAWLCDLPAPLLANLVQAHRSGGVDVLGCLAAQCGYGDSTGNLKKGIATRVKNAQGRFDAGCVSVAQQLLDLGKRGAA